jgi:hypothetical protein
VLALIDGYNTEANIIGKLSGKSPQRIEKLLYSVRSDVTLPCMIKPDVLVSQNFAIDEHRARCAQNTLTNA